MSVRKYGHRKQQEVILVDEPFPKINHVLYYLASVYVLFFSVSKISFLNIELLNINTGVKKCSPLQPVNANL